MTTDQLHRLLLDNLNTAVLLLSDELLIDYINPAAESLLQVSSARLCGTSVDALFANSESISDALHQALQLGRPHTRRHEYLRIHGVEASQVDYSITPVELQGKKMRCHLGIGKIALPKNNKDLLELLNIVLKQNRNTEDKIGSNLRTRFTNLV